MKILTPRQLESLDAQYEGYYVLKIVRKILAQNSHNADKIKECSDVFDLIDLATCTVSYSDITGLCDSLDVPVEWFEKYYEWEEEDAD